MQVNLELLTMDKRTFVTDHERALQSLFGENSDSSPQFRGDISSIAARLATVFASLKVGTAGADASASIMPGGAQGTLPCIAEQGHQTLMHRTCIWPRGHHPSFAVPQPAVHMRHFMYVLNINKVLLNSNKWEAAMPAGHAPPAFVGPI